MFSAAAFYRAGLPTDLLPRGRYHPAGTPRKANTRTPSAEDADDDPAGQATWEIATAASLRASGDLAAAAAWYRKATNHLMEAGEDERAVEIAKLAAELVALEASVRAPAERAAPTPDAPPANAPAHPAAGSPPHGYKGASLAHKAPGARAPGEHAWSRSGDGC